MISVGILFSNIGTIEDNKKAEASSTQSTTEQTSATTESSSSLLINQETQTSSTTSSVPREYQAALNQAKVLKRVARTTNTTWGITIIVAKSAPNFSKPDIPLLALAQ